MSEDHYFTSERYFTSHSAFSAVSPVGKGGACMCEMKRRAKFATVSGKSNSSTNPEALYRKYGFVGNDIWHIGSEREFCVLFAFFSESYDPFGRSFGGGGDSKGRPGSAGKISVWWTLI